MDYVLNHEDYDASKFGIHNDCYNFYTLGTQKGDWSIPSSGDLTYRNGPSHEFVPYKPSGTTLFGCEFDYAESVQLNILEKSYNSPYVNSVIGYDINGNSKYIRGYTSEYSTNMQLYFRPHIYIKDFVVKNVYYVKSGTTYKSTTTYVPVKHDQTYAEQNISIYSQKTYDIENGETPNTFLANNNRYPILDEELILTIVPEIIIVNINGSKGVTKGVSYIEQGYSKLYSKYSYDSFTETPEQFEVQNKIPIAGEKLYTTCNPIKINVYINNSKKAVIPSQTYAEQGYSTIYSQGTFNPANNETAADFILIDRLPVYNERIFTTCTVITYKVYVDNVYTTVTGYKYSEQGYTHIYSQQIYNVDNNESASNFDIVNTYPYSNQHVYTSMLEITNNDCIIYYDDIAVIVDPTKTFAEQGYESIYDNGGMQDMLNEYPTNGTYYKSYQSPWGGGGSN